MENKQEEPPVRRRSKRIQENFTKRNHKEFQYSAFVSTISQKDKLFHPTPGKLDLSINQNSLSDIPKQIPVESPIPLKQGGFGEERKEEVLTDNECHSLKIPSLIDFNMSNISKENGRPFGEERLSNSPLSYKRYNFGFADNLTDNEMNEAIENIRNINPSRKNSLTDNMYLKRLGATSFVRYRGSLILKQNKLNIIINNFII